MGVNGLDEPAELAQVEAAVEAAHELVVLALEEVVEPVRVGLVEREPSGEPRRAPRSRDRAPSSTGRSRSRLAAKAWIVSIRARCRPISASSIRPRAASSSCERSAVSSPSLTLAASSAAAASVNVITASSSTVACPEASSATTRRTSTLVLPVPAPASTQRLRSSRVAISSRTA
ncbi:MAG: hypothetical protein U0R69_13360 [Gaiellales bacterium]